MYITDMRAVMKPHEAVPKHEHSENTGSLSAILLNWRQNQEFMLFGGCLSSVVGKPSHCAQVQILTCCLSIQLVTYSCQFKIHFWTWRW